MKRNTVIIYASNPPECYGNLKLFCDLKGIKYNTYSRKKLPFEYEGSKVYRVPFIMRSLFINNINKQIKEK